MRIQLAIVCVTAGATSFALASVPGAASVQSTTVTQVGGRGSGTTGTTTITDPTQGQLAVGTSAVSGIVTDAETRQPVAGALVQLYGGTGSGQRPRQMTDSKGRFIFTRLPAYAEYTVGITHASYLQGGYQAAAGAFPSVPISITDGQWFQDANAQLWKPSSISGMVMDERGDPVVGVAVRVLLQARVAGRVHRAAGPATETDDLGMYRLPDLRPGQYLVHVPSVQITLPDSAIAKPGPNTVPLSLVRTPDGLGHPIGHGATPPASTLGRAYPMAYHPAARAIPQAEVITLAHGESRTSVDVQLTLAPTVRISGTVEGPAASIARMPIRLVPAGNEASGPGSEVALTLGGPEGQFTFVNVPAGEYTVIASRTQSEYTTDGGIGMSRLIPDRGNFFNNSMSAGQVTGSNGLSYATRSVAGDASAGHTPLVVGDRDITDLVVSLIPAVTVSGHFLWDGSETPPEAVRSIPSFRLEPADGDLTRGFPRFRSPVPVAAGLPTTTPMTFIVDVLPGRYIMGSTSISGYTLEAAEWRGRDILSSPLDVTGDANITGVIVRMTSRRTTVSGTVHDTAGAPARGATVLFFPASPAEWNNYGLSASRFRTSSVGLNGTYRNTQLLPGEYFVAAVPAADRSRWLDPEFLASLSAAATRVRVEAGATITQNLRVTGGR